MADNKSRRRNIIIIVAAILLLLGAIRNCTGGNDQSSTGSSGKDQQSDETKVTASEDSSSPASGASFNVELNVEATGEKGKPAFEITTNLPDETEMMLTLTGESGTAQAKATVKDGKALAEPMSDGGNPLSGDFVLTVSTSLPRLQTDAVRAVIGENGENMSGQYIVQSDISDANVVHAEFPFSFEGGDSIVEAEAAPEAGEQTAPQGQIENVIRSRITEKYTLTDIDSITINGNLGTEAPDDYIALVNLTWTQQNSGKTSREMLSMYSEDLAATVGNECPSVQEIVIFWNVPYLNDTAKCSYERKGAGMSEMDIVWGRAFNE